jgi:hypothetical protein
MIDRDDERLTFRLDGEGLPGIWQPGPHRTVPSPNLCDMSCPAASKLLVTSPQRVGHR